MLFKRKSRDPRLKRLEMEHQLLEDLCSHSDLIDFEVIKPRKGIPPDKYRLQYYVKSIVGIDEMSKPVYGNHHTVKITLPPGYPMTSSPVCYVESDIWHPNIRSKGEYKGHICINAQVLGHWHTIDMLVTQIGEMLQYKNYHAENIQPYPEDAIVAKWVREYAEPKGIISLKDKVTIDDRPLIKPSTSWLETRKKRITILGVKKRGATQDSSFSERKVTIKKEEDKEKI